MQSFQFGAAQFVFDPAGEAGTLIKFGLPALQLMVANRGQLPTGGEWQSPGIYFLFGSGDTAGTYRIYVGMAPTGVAKRVSEQERQKDWWDRALLVISDRSSGFTMSDVAWLEARFITKLRNELGNGVANKVQPAGDRLEAWAAKELEAHVAPIEAVLRLLGMLSISAEPQIDNDDDSAAALGGSAVPATGESAVEASPRVVGNPTWVDATLQVLPVDGSGMHARDILQAIKDRNLRDLTIAKTPENTLRRDLRQEAGRAGARVVQVGPSMFALPVSSPV